MLRFALQTVVAYATCLLFGRAMAVEVPIGKLEIKPGVSAKAYCADSGNRCYIADGTSAVLKVYGAGVAQANAVSDGGSTNLTTTLGASQVGMKEVNVNVSSGANRGDRDITLRYNLNGNTLTEWKFRVYVINNGAITGVDMPRLDNYFTQADVAVNGTSLDHARVTLWGYPRPQSATAIDNNATRAVVRLTWTTLQSRPQFKFRLCDDALPLCGNVDYGKVEDAIDGPAALSSIQCNAGSTASSPARVGDPMMIRFTLNGPARAAPGGRGQPIYWQLIDSNRFQPTTGVPNNCPFTVGQRNEFSISAGSNERQCTVTVASAGAMGTTTQYVEAWTINPNTNAAPYYFKQACYIRQ
jgi:hypothetical protein